MRPWIVARPARAGRRIQTARPTRSQAGAGEERTAPAGLVGFRLLLRADVTPAGTGSSGSGGSGGSSGSGGSGGSGSAGGAGSSGRGITLSAKQLRINQRIYQAAVRRANAIEARIEGRPAPAPPARSGGGRVTLTRKQLCINQRIAQAAMRRANALDARVP